MRILVLNTGKHGYSTGAANNCSMRCPAAVFHNNTLQKPPVNARGVRRTDLFPHQDKIFRSGWLRSAFTAAAVHFGNHPKDLPKVIRTRLHIRIVQCRHIGCVCVAHIHQRSIDRHKLFFDAAAHVLAQRFIADNFQIRRENITLLLCPIGICLCFQPLYFRNGLLQCRSKSGLFCVYPIRCNRNSIPVEMPAFQHQRFCCGNPFGSNCSLYNRHSNTPHASIPAARDCNASFFYRTGTNNQYG